MAKDIGKEAEVEIKTPPQLVEGVDFFTHEDGWTSGQDGRCFHCGEDYQSCLCHD